MKRIKNNSSTQSKFKGVELLLGILLLFSLNANLAQTPKATFDRLGSDQGLIPGNVNDIFQDSLGFIWLATENGLSRYDGYKFIYFQNEINNSNSLSHNHVFSLLKGENGILWVGTLGGGLNKFDVRTGKFKRFQHNPDDPKSISDDIVFKLFRDTKNRIWISTLGGGLNLFDPVSETFTHFRHSENDHNSISSDIVSALYEDSENNFWVGTFDAGMNLFDVEKNKFIHYLHNPSDDNSISFNQVMDFLEDDKGRFWVATFGGGVNLFHKETEHFSHMFNQKEFPLKTNHFNIRKLFEDEEYLWIGSYSGLYRFDKNNFDKEEFYFNPNDQRTINNDKIRSIFKDRTDVLWFGTTAGVNRYDSNKKKFQVVTFKEKYEVASDNLYTVPSIYITDKILWAKKESLSYGNNGSRKIKFFGNVNTANGFHTKIAPNLYIDENQILWVGSYNGLQYYDNKKNEFVYIQYVDDGTPALGTNYIKCFYIDKENNFWAGTLAGGLSLYNSKKKEYRRYIHLEGNKESISDSRVMEIYEDSYGILWIGTYGGLNIFNKENETFSRYQVVPNDSTCISNDRIYSIHESKAGDLWIGTYRGLNKFNREDNNFIQYTEDDGLTGSTIYGILEDKHGNLWIRTNEGISKFNPTTKIFNNYHESDGLPGMELIGNVYFQNNDGRMFFGSSNGLISFYPDDIHSNPHKANVVLTGLKIMDKEVEIGKDSPLQKPLNEVEELVFSYKDKVISFEFAALHFAIPSKNKYAYKLEGFLDEWAFVDANNRVAKFTNLSPGEYTLRITASNNDGIWNNNERVINITVTPPFWETWWFRVLALLTLLGIIFLFYEYRLNRLLDVERTRSRIARNLHDEIGGTLSSIQYFVRAIEKDNANGQANGRAKFLNLIMKSSYDAQEKIKDLIWTVNPEEDGLGKFLIKFNRYASDLLESKEINYDIHIPTGNLNKSISMEKRQHLWCICKETLTNTIKHSQCSNVKIKFGFNGKILEYSISDDGIGFDRSKEDFSNGIVNIKNRAKIIHADYSLETSLKKGTLWTFSIKI